ncbi:MAG: restriction endonuclease subunit S [Treponema sp.]|nr:restriction endonuclease subunit S [Treponema sp.]
MKKKLEDVISKEFKGLWGTDFSDDGIPVIKTNNMTYEGRIDFSDICVRNIPYKEAENNFLKKGDLIIEKSGGTKTHSVGYVNIFEGEDDKYVCNNFILPLRPNTDIVYPKYLFWQLHGMYEAGRFSDCYNKTTGIQNLQKKTYFSKDINIPPLPDQQKIAAHLDKIQSAIDNKKQQLSLLDEAVKSKFVEMFGNPITNTKGFPTKKVIDVVTLQRGYDLPVQDRDTNGKIPVFGSNGILGTHNVSKIDKGVITGRSGTIGEVYMSEEPFWPLNTTLFSNDIHGNNICYLKFLLEFFDLKRFKSGIGVPTLNRNEFHGEQIIDVSLDLQNQFAAFVQQIDKAKSIAKQQVSDLQELLDSKMQHYFA